MGERDIHESIVDRDHKDGTRALELARLDVAWDMAL
jgi:hypothetical protein